MADILLSTLNARYTHAAFGLRLFAGQSRRLAANAPRSPNSTFRNGRSISPSPILARQPRILGLGVYIWNVGPDDRTGRHPQASRAALDHRTRRPRSQPRVRSARDRAPADYTITGEADLEFAKLCGQLLRGQRPLIPIIQAEPPSFAQLQFPYALYDDRTWPIASSTWKPRAAALFRASFACRRSTCRSVTRRSNRSSPSWTTAQRGVKQFKFVDRTFNLNINIGRAILRVFSGAL